MKFKINFLIVLVFFGSCTDDETMPLVTPLDSLNVRITSPKANEFTIPGDSILFQAELLGDSTLDVSSLKAVWESDIDGILYEGGLNDNGLSEFYSNTLSKNIHNVTFIIRNELDSTLSSQVIIFNAIKLLPLEKTDNSIHLKWCAWNPSIFNQYNIFRSLNSHNISDGELIYSSNDRNDTTFTDTTAILGKRYYYQVFMDYNNNEDVGSNIQSITAGKFIKTDYPVLKIIYDPLREYAYGIVRPKSIFDSNKTGYGLIFINIKDFQVEKRILNHVKFSDMDIDLDGNYLYLVGRSSTLYKIDLNNQALEQIFSLSKSAHKIEIGSDNKLFYHITPPTSGSTGFRIFDLTNSVNIPDKRPHNNPLTLRHGDMELNSLSNQIIHGESNSTGSSISIISTENDSLRVIDQWGQVSSFRELILFNKRKNIIAWHHRLYDYNLDILGTFNNGSHDESIYALSPNGELAIGWSSMFRTADQEKIKEIPANYDITCFIGDNQLLLSFSESRIYQEFESYIFIYSL